MKALSVHFPEKQHLQVSCIVEKTKLTQSQVSRAALQIGLKALRESDDVISDVLINDAKAKN
jgi:hypothetical protein